MRSSSSNNGGVTPGWPSSAPRSITASPSTSWPGCGGFPDRWLPATPKRPARRSDRNQGCPQPGLTGARPAQPEGALGRGRPNPGKGTQSPGPEQGGGTSLDGPDDCPWHLGQPID